MVLPAPELPAWLSALVPFKRYRVSVGNYAMHVMETGEGRPVLLLHGNPTWGFLYRKVASALSASGLRVIMPDLVGLGFSDKPRHLSEHRLDLHGAWLRALLDELDLQNLIFVGQDWGGPIGLLALAERRDRLAGLVILNTVVGPPRPGFRPTLFHRFANVPLLSNLGFRVLGIPQVALNRAQGDPSSIRGNIARAYRYPLRHLRDRVAPLGLARMVPNDFHHPSIEPLRKCQNVVETFRGPSAIVWGTKDPVLGRVQSHVTRMLPGARLTTTDAGHFVPEEAPFEIVEAIRYIAAKLGTG